MTAIAAAPPIAADLMPVSTEPTPAPGFADLIATLFAAPTASGTTAGITPPRDGLHEEASLAPGTDEDGEPDDTEPSDQAAWMLPDALFTMIETAQPPHPRPGYAAATVPAAAPILPGPADGIDGRAAPATPASFIALPGTLRAAAGAPVAAPLASPLDTPAATGDTGSRPDRAAPQLTNSLPEPGPVTPAAGQPSDSPRFAAALPPSPADTVQPLAFSPTAVAPPAVETQRNVQATPPVPIAVAPAHIPTANEPPGSTATFAVGVPLPAQPGRPAEPRVLRTERPEASRRRSDTADPSPVATAAAASPATGATPQQIEPSVRLAGLPEAAPSRIAASIADAAPGAFDIATDQLGAVRVTLDARDGRVAVQLSAETPAAGQLLAAHPARLADAVASGGQRLDALAVDVRSGGGQGGRQSPDPRPQPPSRQPPEPAARAARTDRFA